MFLKIPFSRHWQVIVVWECQLQPKMMEQTMLQVELLLNEHFLALHHPKTVAYDFQETPISMAAEDQDPYGSDADITSS